MLFIDNKDSAFYILYSAFFHSHLCVGFDMWHTEFHVNERTKEPYQVLGKRCNHSSNAGDCR